MPCPLMMEHGTPNLVPCVIEQVIFTFELFCSFLANTGGIQRKS